MNTLSVIKSTLAAMIGIQSKKNLRKDFSQSSILPFILSGIIFTLLFIGTIIFIVKIILR
jgi:hypothetical protein